MRMWGTIMIIDEVFAACSVKSLLGWFWALISIESIIAIVLLTVPA
jgi:hypothetical protein